MAKKILRENIKLFHHSISYVSEEYENHQETLSSLHGFAFSLRVKIKGEVDKKYNKRNTFLLVNELVNDLLNDLCCY